MLTDGIDLRDKPKLKSMGSEIKKADTPKVVQDFLKGLMDLLLGVPTDFLPRIEAEKSLKVVTMPGTEVFYMPMNTSVAPLTDIKVREAIALAVNQKEILTSIFGGLGMVANNFLGFKAAHALVGRADIGKPVLTILFPYDVRGVFCQQTKMGLTVTQSLCCNASLYGDAGQMSTLFNK